VLSSLICDAGTLVSITSNWLKISWCEKLNKFMNHYEKRKKWKYFEIQLSITLNSTYLITIQFQAIHCRLFYPRAVHFTLIKWLNLKKTQFVLEILFVMIFIYKNIVGCPFRNLNFQWPLYFEKVVRPNLNLFWPLIILRAFVDL
jgi:hypothetical protein